jgi:dynein heavy chain
MNLKIEGHPKDIEELTALKDYMASVPNEIEKLQKELKDCLNIYTILDQFNYKFADDDDYGRKWKVFGAPLDTSSRIDKQLNILQVLQDKYLGQMTTSMEDFEKTINDITD